MAAAAGRIEAGRFRRERVVEDADVDELGHVNNVVWVRFAVELAVAHSAAVGIDTAAYRRLGAWWIVHRHEIEYRLAAFPGERMVEETWISELRGARSVRECRFRRASDDALLVEARTTWVFVDAARQRPRRVAPEVQAAFEVIPDQR